MYIFLHGVKQTYFISAISIKYRASDSADFISIFGRKVYLQKEIWDNMATKTQVFQLLSKDSSKNLHLNPKAVSLLEQITDPLVIVSVAGKENIRLRINC